MQDLRIILIILGAAAIAALLIHGLWTSQKGRQKPMREKPISKVANATPENDDGEFDKFDSDGIGRVKVLASHQAASLSRDHEIEDDWQISPHFSSFGDDDADEPSIGLPPTLSSSVFSEDVDTLANGDVAKPAAKYVAPKNTSANTSADSRTQSARTQPVHKRRQTDETAAELRARQYREGEIDPLFDNHEFDNHEFDNHELDGPKFAKNEFNSPELASLDLDEQASLAAEFNRSAPPEPMIDEQPAGKQVDDATPQTASAAPEAEPGTGSVVGEAAKPAAITKTWQDVYVISLMAKPGQMLAGTDLIRAVTDAGFVFGDMDIFHRYQGAGNQGEALFSLANMVNPGTFNPNAMSEFSTPGVSIFMQLPQPGMAKNHFNMMIQAADNMAEDLDAVLLDGKRNALGLDYLVRCRSELNDFDSQAQ